MMKEKDLSLDIVRIFAVFTVISVHFFLNNGFYNQPMVGKRMLIMTIGRTFFMVCVPLFILLTGYLMGNKKVSRKYYAGLKKTIGIYILASIACMLFNRVYAHRIYGVKGIILSILKFSGAPYSWYVEMYIGLFLMIPFLNLIYKGLDSKKKKQVLVFTFLILTAFPSILNIFDFNNTHWWYQASADGVYQKILPEWWKRIYPLTYYFIGNYLKEYGLKLNIRKSIVYLIVLTVGLGTFCFYRSYASGFVWGDWADYPSLVIVIMSVLVFHILRKIGKRMNNFPQPIKNLIGKMSGLVLGTYLVSYIFDSIIYNKLNSCTSNICLFHATIGNIERNL